MIKKIITLTFFIIMLLPAVALADGGAPLLLLFNFYTFLFGTVIIILVECIVFHKMASIPWEESLWASIIVNILSTLVIGFAFPIALAFVTIIFANKPSNIGNFIGALGTWVFEGQRFSKLAIIMTLVWLIASFVLTIYYERKLLNQFCVRRKIIPSLDLLKLSVYANSITYAGIFIFYVALAYRKI